MDGGAVAGEGGYQTGTETAELACPHCGEAAAPFQALCGNCGEALPDDGTAGRDFVDAEDLGGNGGDWSMVGVQLVGYIAALALAVIAVAVTVGPWLWRQYTALAPG
ncbi:MAG: hypothetical protein HZB16_04535 [Armatimonadetes bacterium]|nr:hypothetical protein [Armatimonadota bacterium]